MENPESPGPISGLIGSECDARPDDQPPLGPRCEHVPSDAMRTPSGLRAGEMSLSWLYNETDLPSRPPLTLAGCSKGGPGFVGRLLRIRSEEREHSASTP